VGLHDRKGRAAVHEVAVVAAAGVVDLEPALELGVEVGQASEVLAVEGGPVELLEGGALEALADSVVVGRAGRDATMADLQVLKAGEATTGELGAVVGEDPGKLDPGAIQALGDMVDEGRGVPGRLVPGDQGADGIAGGGVNGGEFPDRADALELADVEGVQGDQIPGGGELAEPKRAILGVLGEDAGGGRDELGQGDDPLGPAAEPMTPQDPLDPGRRKAHPRGRPGGRPAAGTEGSPGDRLGQHRLDLVRWLASA
jgi:hypothetical protein